MKACLSAFAFSLLVLAACSSDPDQTGSTTSSSSSGGGAKTDAGEARCAPNVAGPEVRMGACEVTLTTHALQEPADQHIPESQDTLYCSNPPTSGPHYAVWANFAEVTKPIDDGYLVHSEEHGAILLLYKCGPEAGAPDCPDVVEQLRQVKARAPNDCGGNKRIIIAPSPRLATRVAAAAWTKSLTADCVDGPIFDEFVAANIGKGPENLCNPGKVFQ